MSRNKWLAAASVSVVATSVVAFAATQFQLQTKLATGGGYLQVQGKAAQVAVGSVVYTYSTLDSLPVKVRANAGYKISSLNKTGALIAFDNDTSVTVPFAKADGANQSLIASFAANKKTVAATVTGQGAVTPSSVSVNYNGNVTMKATPTYTYGYVAEVKVDGTKVAGPVLGPYSFSVNNVTTDKSVAVTFQNATVKLGSNKVVATGSAVTLNSNAAGGTDIAWYVDNSLQGATGSTYSYTALEGAHTIKVTNSVAGKILSVSTVQVTGVADVAAAMSSNCNGCHDPLAGALPSDAYGDWSASSHKASSVTCVSCHTDGPMPTPVNTATVAAGTFLIKASSAGTVGTNFCAKCHSNIAIRLHDAEAKSDCAACHSFNAHSLARTVVAGSVAEPHVGGAVAPGHAQYLSAQVACDNCHTGNQAAILAEFRQSGHGNPAAEAWAHYDWRLTSRASCQRCHNGTVFAARLDSAGLNASSNFFAPYSTAAKGKPGEVVNCSACHSDLATGALRTATSAFTINASNQATISYDVPGGSALCVRCHGGRESGDSIKLSTGNFGDLPFINSHYLAAGGVIYTKSGYEYAGQTYDTLGYHKNAGKDDVFGTGTAGPCVACHMSAGNGHTWEFLTKDGNGHITANNSTMCAKCHDGLTGAALEADKEEYEAALDALKTALAAKGILFNNAHPYFYKDLNGNGIYDAATEAGAANAFKNWDGLYPGKGKDVMGAAFNYNLLAHEPGAWAHNKQYALKLIADSCDLLADGVVNGTGIPAAVTTAQSSKAFAESTGHPAPIVADGTPTNCAACHVPTPHYGGNAYLKAQYVSAASLPISCADCHSDSVSANSAILVQFGQSAHGDSAGEAWIHYDWRTGNRSSCARCHTATGFVAKLGNENDTSNVFQSTDNLKPGEALACSACHVDAGTGELRTAAQPFTLNMKNGATVSYDVAGASTLCVRCHSGRETGDSIKLDGDTTGVRPFVESHYQPAAGTLYNRAGYEYAGQSYDLGSHKLLGATSQGPCVTCHMPGKNHTFVAASCGACHNGTTAPIVDAATLKATYDAALNDLKLALEAKGIYYGPVHPFFFTAPYVAGSANLPYTNWGAAYGPTAWKDTMGAAFNYNLLLSEKGAFAHNYNYAMKLIADSIDFLNDGAVSGP